MPRVKRGVRHVKRRKNLLKETKGYSGGKQNLIKRARTATLHAGTHAYVDRRKKKRNARSLWLIKINAALRELGTTYSKFIAQMSSKNIVLDRKVLSDIAHHHPKLFAKIVEKITG